MKKIKIFLASSITELKFDRLEVGDFVRQLNDIYFDRGVQFSLIKCDDYDNAIAAGGKQAELDREICDSELCFFLFFKKVGDYIRHEFEIALEAFRTCQRPKIVTYFKYVDTPEEATGDVRAFMQMLDDEIKHYYNIYQNIDTLKLGILMQIKLLKLDAEEPKVEGGKVTFGGMTVAETENLPVFSSNHTLAELKARLQHITQEYYSLREQYKNDLGNDDLHLAYSKVASEKAELEEKLAEEENKVLEATRRMLENTAKGQLSARQVAAYRAFERGDYDDALEILDLGEIMAELSRNETMSEGYAERIQTNVNELLQRIEVMEADGVDRDEAVEIAEIYETAVKQIEKHNLEKGPLYDYVCFLRDQNDHEKAIEIAEQLSYYYSDPKAPTPERNKTMVWNLLGILYGDTQRYEEAEEVYKKALGIRERLAEEDPAEHEPDLATSYNNLGILYEDTQRYKKAEEMHRKAIEIRERLAKEDPAEHEPDLATSYNNLGILYKVTQRYEEAEKTYLKALEICERLAKEDPTAFEPDLAASYNNLGNLYCDTQRYAEAEEAYRKALEIYGRLTERNPAAFEPDLAMSYNNLGILYKVTQRYEEAEESYLKALEVRARLAKEDPTAFEPDLATSYNNLGNLYCDAYRYEEAEEAYRKALEIRERMAERNPAAFEPDLAVSYYNLGNLYQATQRYEEAEEAYRKALEIRERLAKENPAAFEPDLARSYNNLGVLYEDTQRYEEAEEAYREAIEIRERLAKENPATFEPDLARGYNNLGDLYENMKRHREAKAAHKRALKLAKIYPQNKICAGILASRKK